MRKHSTTDKRAGLLLLISGAAVLALFFDGPIPQDQNYHLFADSRRMFGVDNFLDVTSNVFFILAGGLGLKRISNLSQTLSVQSYSVLCLGVLFVAFGSAYYHLAPTNESLVWDRLPMTVAFMALFSLLLGERVTRNHNRYILWLLLAAGIGSVLYWAWTESSGNGDLRPYAVVQFLPIILMPLILIMFRQRYLSNTLLIWAFALYFLAKVFEYFDAQIFTALGFISGHSIKHIAAAAAVLCIIYAVPTRR
jgi:hypothetical protein